MLVSSGEKSSISIFFAFSCIFKSDRFRNFSWLKFNTPHSSVVLGNVNEGNLIIALADRTNVWDTQFFHADDRIADVETLYTTESIIKAKKIIDTYQINYIYFSEKTKEFYGVDSLPYTSDENCFKEVYSNEFATIYQVVC